MTLLLSQSDALRIPLADKSVHCVITSPPYWGLRDYGLPPLIWDAKPGCNHTWGERLPQHHPGQVPDSKWRNNPSLAKGQNAGAGSFCQACTAWKGNLGLEPAPDLFISHIVQIFREIRRVLRDDGICWLNLGDTYAGNRGNTNEKPGYDNKAAGIDGANLAISHKKITDGLKPKDLVGIPWRAALALQADGWWLRSDTIWAKGISFCDTYSGSCMPESVNGWRWEQHRIRVENGDGATKYTDCPGCPKCEANDGLVLRKGSWRPTKGHEYLFMLTRSTKYFCDAEAIKELAVCAGKAITLGEQSFSKRQADGMGRDRSGNALKDTYEVPPTRNLRSVWTINPKPYRGAHFAAFPPSLVEPCIKASTSEKGVCAKCGSPWARVVERQNARQGNNLSWKPTCTCFCNSNTNDPELPMRGEPFLPTPAIVLDPFAGSGTTLMAARDLGRSGIGFDLNYSYLHDQAVTRLQTDGKPKKKKKRRKTHDDDLSDLPLFNK